MRNKIDACLFGFFVGDALGVPIEFRSREELSQDKVVGMREYGSHHQPKGTWSDDSSMVLATMDGLMQSDDGKIDYSKIMNCFLDWDFDGKYTPHNYVFDIGGATGTALLKYKMNISSGYNDDVFCGDDSIYSNGNGSLMRILPIALYLYFAGIEANDGDEYFEVMKKSSSLTHAHNYSVLCCYLYSAIVEKLLLTDSKNFYPALRGALREVDSYIREHEDDYEEDNEVYKRFIQDATHLKNIDEIKSSGYVIDSLEASIWCVLNTNSFEEAVLMAVNLGDDTDTIGALTGALAGLVYGYKAIPKAWINALQRKDYLEDMVSSFKKYLKKLEGYKKG